VGSHFACVGDRSFKCTGVLWLWRWDLFDIAR
jgi:hypothetical protein